LFCCSLDPQGEIYYFNFATGKTTWEYPLKEDNRELVIKAFTKAVDKEKVI
jgi:hypothetical protein